jgi:hypothetical protein
MQEVSRAFDIGRALSHGWAGVKRQPVGLLLGSLLLTLTEGGGGGGNPGGGKLEWGDDSPDPGSSSLDLLRDGARGAFGDAFDLHTAGGIGLALVALVCVAFCLAAVLSFRCWILSGYIRTQRDLVIRGEAGAGTLFSGGPDVVRLVLWKLLSVALVLGVVAVAAIPALVGGGAAYLAQAGETTIAVIAGTALFVFVVPTMIYVGLGLALGDQAVVVDGFGPVAALDRSWSLARGNRLSLFAFFLVTGLFRLSGFLLCCVGIVLTRAMADMGVTESYMLATQSDTEGWATLA